MVGDMGQADAGAIARDIRWWFSLVGIPELREDSNAGGYGVLVLGSHVRVSWTCEVGFDDRAGQIGVDHPQHPMNRLERQATAVMERALADVLYAAGFTIALRPGVPDPDPEKARDPVLTQRCRRPRCCSRRNGARLGGPG